jgi:hypothetical protein
MKGQGVAAEIAATIERPQPQEQSHHRRYIMTPLEHLPIADAETDHFLPTSDKQRPLKSKAKCAIDATAADIASA